MTKLNVKKTLNLPHWYDPISPLGSAVRFLTQSNPKFNWVGVYLLKGKLLKLGPFLGEPTPHHSIRVGHGVCGSAVSENRDKNIGDVSSEKNYLSCSLKTKSEFVALIKNKKGKILGQIDIDSHQLNTFGQNEVNLIQQVAKELGELWPV